MSPLERSRKKLREAAFFLDHMWREDQATDTDSEIFGYYTSAFLSAAQSAYYVLRDHGGRTIQGRVHQWLKDLNEEARTLILFLGERRGREVHAFGFVRRQTGVLTLGMSWAVARPGQPVQPPLPAPAPTPTHQVGRWRFDERLPGRDDDLEVMPACERLLQLGHEMVHACAASSP